jgi:hypothetical protein
MDYSQKLLCTAIALIIITSTAFSQSITTEVFASSGSNFSDGGTSLNWTLGESFTETYEISSGIQTLGFHQTFFETPQVVPQLTDADLKVYPNPFSEYLYVKSMKPSDKTHIRIFNATGDIVFDKKFYTTSTCKLNLSQLSDGIYYLKIDSDVKSSFKIVKVSN